MPLPLIKLGIVTVRVFARPFNAVLTRRLRHQATDFEKDFYSKIGMKVFALENYIDEQFQKSSST